VAAPVRQSPAGGPAPRHNLRSPRLLDGIGGWKGAQTPIGTPKKGVPGAAPRLATTPAVHDRHNYRFDIGVDGDHAIVESTSRL